MVNSLHLYNAFSVRFTLVIHPGALEARLTESGLAYTGATKPSDYHQLARLVNCLAQYTMTANIVDVFKHATHRLWDEHLSPEPPCPHLVIIEVMRQELINSVCLQAVTQNQTVALVQLNLDL